MSPINNIIETSDIVDRHSFFQRVAELSHKANLEEKAAQELKVKEYINSIDPLELKKMKKQITDERIAAMHPDDAVHARWYRIVDEWDSCWTLIQAIFVIVIYDPIVSYYSYYNPTPRTIAIANRARQDNYPFHRYRNMNVSDFHNI